MAVEEGESRLYSHMQCFLLRAPCLISLCGLREFFADSATAHSESLIPQKQNLKLPPWRPKSSLAPVHAYKNSPPWWIPV
jgi:hypothetical protein